MEESSKKTKLKTYRKKNLSVVLKLGVWKPRQTGCPPSQHSEPQHTRLVGPRLLPWNPRHHQGCGSSNSRGRGYLSFLPGIWLHPMGGSSLWAGEGSQSGQQTQVSGSPDKQTFLPLILSAPGCWLGSPEPQGEPWVLGWPLQAWDIRSAGTYNLC